LEWLHLDAKESSFMLEVEGIGRRSAAASAAVRRLSFCNPESPDRCKYFGDQYSVDITMCECRAYIVYVM
jgi:hypothetical protein